MVSKNKSIIAIGWSLLLNVVDVFEANVIQGENDFQRIKLPLYLPHKTPCVTHCNTYIPSSLPWWLLCVIIVNYIMFIPLIITCRYNLRTYMYT